MTDSVPLAPFTAAYAPDDIPIAAQLLAAARLGSGPERRIDSIATRLIEAVRAKDDRLGWR